MKNRDRERHIDTFWIGDDCWNFYRDVMSDCFVARKFGDEDRPRVAVRFEALKRDIGKLYPGYKWRG